MSPIGRLHCGLEAIESGNNWGTIIMDKARTSNRREKVNTWKKFFLIYMPPNQDRNFSSGLVWSGHLGPCGGLVYGLSGKNLEDLNLDDDGNRPDIKSGDSIRDVREAGGRVLRLCNYPIKVFNTFL